MITAVELREHCKKLRIQREEDLKSVLSNYFEYYFISGHRPWKAVIGNKKCKPIPIHRDFYSSGMSSSEHKFEWPNFSEEALRQSLINLGFYVTEHRISLCVPPCEEGKELTFAQDWVKKINTSYSEYCANEKEVAKKRYSEFLSKLYSTPLEKTKTFSEYTLFCDFKFDTEISSVCNRYMLRFMSRDGIAQYFEDGKYKGIIVSTKAT